MRFEPLLIDLFKLIQEGQLRAVTSELTLAEVLVKPLADGKTEICTAYTAAVQDSASLEVMPVTREVLVEAAGIRAKAGVRLPDAIHIATAVLSGCRSFLTNDKSIMEIPNMKVIYLSDV